MAAAKTIDVDMNSAKKKTNTYNCKGAGEINVTYDKDFVIAFGKNVTLSGTTLTIKADEKTYKFKNISDTAMLNILTSNETSQYHNPLGSFLKTYVNWIPAKGTKVTGSKFDDVIDVSSYENAKGKGLTVNAAAGSDLISSTKYADTLTGGVGFNVIEYTSLAQLDGDKINLTKGENLAIDLSGIANASAEYRVSGKNLVVTVSNGKDDPKSFTINNFGTKDVTNNKTKKTADTSSVELMLSPTTTVDLRTVLVDADNGTWHNDNIDRSDYEIKKKGVVVTDWTKKGLSLNGAAGNDIIVGTNYSDTIKGGDGDDAISGGTGNDKLYGGNGDDIITGGAGTDTLYGDAGKNTFVFAKGDGADTVYSGTGEDTLLFSGINSGELTYAQGEGKKNNKNLVIGYGNGDSVTVKNYFTVDKGGNITGVNSKNTVKYIYTANGKVALETAMEWAELYPGKNLIISSGEIAGTQSGDVILGAETNDTFTGKKGDDVLYGKGGNDTYVFNSGDGKDVIYAEGGDDTIKFNGITESALTFTQGTGDNVKDLIVGYGSNDSVTVKNYFEESNKVKYLETSNGKFLLEDVRTYVTKYPGKNLIISSGEINGTDADEILVGGSANDIITGNKGNDALIGNAGNDAYVFNSGDGVDVIEAVGGIDTIKFVGEMNDQDLLVFSKASNDKDLVIKYGMERSSNITVKDFYNTDGSINTNCAIKYVQFKDADPISITTAIEEAQELPDTVVEGSGENFNITGNTKYVIGSAGNDTINLAASNQVNVVVNAGEGDNTVTGKNGVSYTVVAGSGNDIISTANGTDIIDAGDGQNTITAGSGQKTITVGNATNPTTNKGSTITLAANGNSGTVITTGTGNDTITVNNTHSNMSITSAGGDNVIDYAKLVDGVGEGVTITTGDGADTITIGNANGGATGNTINAGNGDNEITFGYGSSGNTISTGSGNDTIAFNSYMYQSEITIAGGTNVITFGNDSDENIINAGGTNTVTFGEYCDSNQVTLTGSGTDSVTIESGYGNVITAEGGGAKTISVGDDTNWSSKNTKITTGSGDDVISVGKSRTTRYYGATVKAGDGHNIITMGDGYDISVTTGNSTNAQTNVGSEITFTGDNNYATVTTGTGNDTIKFTGTDALKATITSAGGNNTIEVLKDYIGSYNSQVQITTGDGNDAITLGKMDNNTINAGNGNNTITVKGRDNIVTTGSGKDTIVVGLENSDNVNRNTVTIGSVDGEGNVTVQGGVENTVTVYGSGSTITINNITQTDGKKNVINFLNGRNYEENTVTVLGGHTEINANGRMDITTGAGNDEITLTGEGVTYSTVDAGDGNNIVISEQGTSEIHTGKGADIITSTGGCTVYSGAGVDTIYIGEGNCSDYVHTGAGDDKIYVDENKLGSLDVYFEDELGTGGHDTIEGLSPVVLPSGQHYLKIRGDISAEYIGEKSGKDLVIHAYKNGVDTGDTITVKNAYKDDGDLIDTLKGNSVYVNNSVLSIDSLPNNMVTNGNGTDGNDWIVGTQGNDPITTGDGEDWIKSVGEDIAVTLSGDDWKNIYFTKSDGENPYSITINGYGASTHMRIFTDDYENLSFSKTGTTLTITNTTGDRFIINGCFGINAYGDETGIIVNNNGYNTIFYNAETLREITNGMLHSTLFNLEGLDVYPDENGIIAGAASPKLNFCHPDDSTNTILVNYNGGVKCNIPATTTGEAITVYIPLSGDSVNQVTYEREGDDLVVAWNPNSVRATIVDYYKGQTNVDWVRFDNDQPAFQLSKNTEINAIDVREAETGQTVSGSWVDNKIVGSEYHDIILGNGGDDVVYAQTGDFDTYICHNGDGHDTIYAGTKTSKTGADLIQFRVDEIDLSYSDFDIDLVGNDLVISYNHVNAVAQDSITIKNYIVDGEINSSVDGINMYSPTQGYSPELTIQQFWNLKHPTTITVNNLSPETVTGTPFAETFNIVSETTGKTVNAAGGDDTITVNGLGNTINGGLGENTINFAKNNSQNTVVSGGGHDTVVMLGESDSTNLKATVSGNDLILGYQNSDASTLTLTDFMNGGHSASTLKMGNQTYDLSAIKSAGNIIFGADGQTSFNGTAGDDIMFVGFNGIDDQQTVNGNGGNDTIVVSDDGKNKMINIGSGDDTIYTQADAVNHPANTITITSYGRPNGGNDVIYWRGAYTVLEMYHTHTKNDVIFTRIANDLVMHYNENDSVTIREYYSGNNQLAGIGDKISISFKTAGDPEPLTLAQTLEYRGLYNYITDGIGTDASDYMVGTSGADTINADAGNDIIKPGDGADNINLGSGNDILYAGAGGKNITAVSGNNIIKLGSGNNTVYAGMGNDTIYSGSGTNTVEFLAADSSYDDYYYGGGTDTLVFKGDAMSDLTVDRRYAYNVVLTRGNSAQVQIKNYETPEHALNIKDKNTVVKTIDNLNTIIGSSTATAVQTLTTGNGNDTIYAGLGSDTITPGAGTNTITLAKAVTGNNDTYVNGNGTDTFVLTDVADFSALTLQKVDNDLLVAYTGDLANNTLTISNYYPAADIGSSVTFRAGENESTLADLITAKGVVEPIVGDDDDNVINKSENVTAVIIEGRGGSDTLTGSAYADKLYGQNGTDILNGGAGNDYLNGGAAADTLNGGADSDTYEIDAADWGDGQDVITDSAGTADVLKINTTADKINLFFDVTLTKTGEEPGVPIVTNGLAEYTTGADLYIIEDDYTLATAKTSGGAKIVNYFTTGKIETVQVPDPNSAGNWINAFDSSVLTRFGQIVANWLYTNGFDSTAKVLASGTDEQKTALYNLYHPVITTKDNWAYSADVIIGMGETPQVINANDNDNIISTVNNTTSTENNVNAGAGKDIIYGSSGKLTVYAEAGNDIIYTGDGGTKNIYAGVGNDTIYTPTDTSNNYMYLTEYGQFTDGGHDTIYWQGGTGDNLLYLFGREYSEVSLARAAGSYDLKLMYGDNNSVTLKDYYKAEASMGANLKLNTQDMGLPKTMATVVSEKGVMNYIEGTSGTMSGTTGKDYIVANTAVTQVEGDKGSDTIIMNDSTDVLVYTAFTNSETDGKDATVGTIDKIIATGEHEHIFYAQSETNILASRGNSSDYYNVYLDQRTSVTDAGGNDTLSVLNTSGYTDGYKSNIHFMFNVSNSYSYDGTAETLFTGNILVTDDASKYNYDCWKSGTGFKGISVDNNAVETIVSADKYSISDAQLSTLAGSVASWLNTNGYANVNGVFSNAQDKADDNAVDIAALIAKFDTVSWDAPTP